MSIFSSLIEYFKTHSDVSSDDIVRDIFFKEYNSIVEKYLYSSVEIEKTKEYLNLKKKALYYLNKLEKENIISLSKKAFKGRKVYNFNFSNNIVRVEGSKIIVEKKSEEDFFSNFSFSFPFDLKEFVSFSDFNSVDSVFFYAENFDFDNDEKFILKFFDNISIVDDSVLFFNPNFSFFNEKFKSLILKFKDKISFNFYFDFKNFNFSLKGFNEIIIFLYENNFNVILGLSFKDFYSNKIKDFLNIVFKVSFFNNSSFYINNIDVSNDIVFLGSKGPYSVSGEEFDIVKNNFKNDNFVLDNNNVFLFCVSQSSVFIDIGKLLFEVKDFSKIRNIILKSGSVLFEHNLFFRQNYNYFFKNFDSYFLDFSKIYFRFWNYGLKQKNLDYDEVMLLLESSRNIIKNYSQGQNTIYTSCGLPLRFKSSFSVLFEDKKPNFFSEKKYENVNIHNIKDFFDKNINKILKLKEKANNIFDGGDRTRFFRITNSEDYKKFEHDFFNELSFIHKTYNFRFYGYDFSKNKKEVVSLKRFF